MSQTLTLGCLGGLQIAKLCNFCCSCCFLLRIAIKSCRLHLKQNILTVWLRQQVLKTTWSFNVRMGSFGSVFGFGKKIKQSAFLQHISYGTFVEVTITQHLSKAITLWVSFQQCTAGASLGWEWDPSFKVIGAILGPSRGARYGGAPPTGGTKAFSAVRLKSSSC